MELTVLPSAPVIEAAFSDPQVVAAGFSSAPISVLPDGFIPIVPLYATAAASGSGTSTVRVALISRMASAGAGAAQVSPRGTVSATASGSGKLTAPAYVVGQAFPTSIDAAGSGAVTAVPTAVAAVTAVSTGQATVQPAVRVAAAASSSGSIAVAPRPVTTATAASSGTATAKPAPTVGATGAGSGTATATPVTFTSAGVQKSGTQNVTSGTYTTITGWAERAGFPFILESDGIRIPANLTVNFTYRVVWGATTPAGGSQEVQLTSDDVALTSTYQNNGQFSTAPVKSGSFVGTGGIVRMHARSNVAGNGSVVTASTYLEISKA